MATRRRARLNSLTTSISDVRSRLKYLEARPSRRRLANYVVRRTNIRPRSVSSDQLAIGAVDNASLEDNSVSTEKIQPGAITSPLIGPGQVINGNLGGGAVDGRVLGDNTIESRHIKDGEVKESDIGPNAVTTTKINGLAVTNDKLAGSISNDKLAGGITNDKLAGSISNDKLAGGITNDKLAGNISNDKLAGGITNEKLAGGITNAKLAGGITNDKLAGNITNDKLAGGITNGKLAGGITNEKLAGGITRDKINPQIISTVTAGSGLSGGGSANSVTLSVNFDSVARQSHTHSQYVTANHTHDNLYSARSHNHFYNGVTTSGGNPSHQHGYSGTTQGPGGSSIRFKTNIDDYTFDTSKILNLSLKKFNYKKQFKPREQNKNWFYGYMAEELLENGFDEVVGYDSDGLPNFVDYSLIGVLSVELLKEQQSRILELERKIENLERILER